MAEIEDYATGKVLESVKQSFDVFNAFEGSLKESKIGLRMLKDVEKYAPKLMSLEGAAQLIQEAIHCAIGERVCRALDQTTPFTESVFLNDLAERMVQVGKARFVTKEDAVVVLEKYRGSPIVVSKVSGNYVEICNTSPKQCVYWNLEKRGLKCITRIEPTPKEVSEND